MLEELTISECEPPRGMNELQNVKIFRTFVIRGPLRYNNGVLLIFYYMFVKNGLFLIMA